MPHNHYHVVENTPGYSPESDDAAYPYLSKRAAHRRMTELKNQLLDDNEELEGSVHYVAEGSAKSGYIFVTDTKSEHDLGRAITIEKCSNQECIEAALAQGYSL